MKAGVAPPTRSLVCRGALEVEAIDEGVIPGWIRFSTGRRGNAGVYSPDGSPCRSAWLARKGMPSRDALSLSRDEFLALKPQRHDCGALYAGLLLPHFGHFLLESTGRLWWALREGFDGTIVFDCDRPDGLQIPFVRRFLEMLGIASRSVVTSGPLQFRRVYVPEQALKLNIEIHAEALRPFRTAVGALAHRPEERRGAPIYVSRTKLGSGVLIGESLIEQSFAKEGFRIVHPQLLGFDDQIRVMLEAPVVAGVAGSAMHTMLFATEPKRAFYLQRLDMTLPTFAMIDQILGTRATYISAAQEVRPSFRHDGPHLLDAEHAFDLLEREGVLRRKNRPVIDRKALMEAYIAEWERQARRRPKLAAKLRALPAASS